MSRTQGATVFRLDQPYDGTALRRLVEDAGYSQTALAKTLSISSPHERQDPEVVYRRIGPGRWVVCGEHLCATEGLPFAGHVDACITLLAGCDGRRTLRGLIAEVAAGMEATPDQLTPGCLVVVRKLMQSGFLNIAGASTGQGDREHGCE